MSNYSSTSPDGGSDSMSTTERYLTITHGDLHEVIPELLQTHTQAELAEYLSDDVANITPSWVAAWLSGRNAAGVSYRRLRRWVPQEDAS